MSGVNQKEYLKKYLGIGKGSGEKKKKKKTKKLGFGLKIVDDDVDDRLNEEIQVDLTADNDEAPQIVSVIDDRPPSLRIDEESHSKLWKPIGAPDESEQREKSLKFEGNMKLLKLGIKQGNLRKQRDSSPVRKKVAGKSPARINRDRLKTDQKNSGPSSDQNFSPVRQCSEDMASPGIGRTQKESASDNSPPRRRQGGEDSDNSPPRRSGMIADRSPVRKRKKSDDSSPPRRRQSKDMSPIRQSNGDNDSSPPRQSKAKRHRDLSPPRKGTTADPNSSPPRKIKIEKSVDNSPPRRRKDGHKKSRWGDSEETSEKMEKTLDGKTAGLQNAADLVKETQEFKKREDELFKKLSSEVSGANAATVVRRKAKEVDSEEEKQKRKIEEENKEQYNRWGKGLKQVEDVNEKIKSDLYEMSKPLARYADDEDLEKHLKDQEREGDPMLAYIRQKKRKKAVDEGKPAMQQYEGDAPPNRFGIRPGYRWDGVDRSSGYEKKWFEVQNSRKADIEESYKWSTEDM